MPTVYGVWSGYEDMDGIFSTKEKAEEYIQGMVATWRWEKSQFGILEYVVDGSLNESSGSGEAK